jgi:hypothetical protein
MHETQSHVDDSLDWKMYSMNASIASESNVERAFWEKLETPEKTTVLSENLSFNEYRVVTEMYYRQLSKLKLEFEPYDENRPNWGRIIVKASKTPVHGIPTALLGEISSRVHLILQRENILSPRAETRIRRDARHYREPDAHMVVRTGVNRFIVAVLESAFSQTVQTSLDEFQEELAEYFVNEAHINVALGVYIPYVAPSAIHLPVPLRMILIVLHRDDAIAPQVIPFGENANHDNPILFTIDTSTLFANAAPVPANLPQSLQFDIRDYYAEIRNSINDLRDEWRTMQESRDDDDDDDNDDDDDDYDTKQKKRTNRKRKNQSSIGCREPKRQDRKPDDGNGRGGHRKTSTKTRSASSKLGQVASKTTHVS